MVRLCTPKGGGGGGAVLGIDGGGVTFRFFKMVRLFLTKLGHFTYVYTLTWLSLKSYSISDYNGQNHMGFLKKSIAFGVPLAYS